MGYISGYEILSLKGYEILMDVSCTFIYILFYLSVDS